jgi:integrase
VTQGCDTRVAAVGRKPLHLSRRGAIYFVRFRIPTGLDLKLGLADLRRSLHTADPTIAKQRCLRATAWFRLIMADLAQHSSPDRAMLERAAVTFFDQLKAEIDQPRGFDDHHFDEDVAYNIEMSRARILGLDGQLVSNVFDRQVAIAAGRLADIAGGSIADLASPERLFAQQLAARAEREKLELLLHMLTHPAKPFAPQDSFFTLRPAPPVRAGSIAQTVTPAGPTLKETVTDYLRRRGEDGVGKSMVVEVGRALRWLQEKLGPERAMDDIRKEDLRGFRDDLVRLNVRMRGTNVAFADRITLSQSDRITSHTAGRYWRSVLAFFNWSAQEGVCTTNPAEGLKLAARKGEVKRTPEQFSTAELETLFQTPLFAGFKSMSRLLQPGERHRRLDHFWSALLPMYTGLRAGELAQLLPSDFKFDAEVPHLRVSTTDDAGNVTKTTKTASSIRDVPIAPPLLELGLAEFVASRGGSKADRLFNGIRLGANRQSDGLTKFWTRYLKTFGLWKPGRSTHVWRHTLIACLRAMGAAEEDVAAFVGHSLRTVTSGYGGAYPLKRKMTTALLIDYGFDVVMALGGPYDPKLHR